MAQHRSHRYSTNLKWVGGENSTFLFRRHDRSYVITCNRKPPIEGSSDAVFRGNAARWNPEDLLVASLSTCHHLLVHGSLRRGPYSRYRHCAVTSWVKRRSMDVK